ncbi:hypothetical protein ACNTMW_18325 [Planosporangium sp. 12N6]|uniref:hypothetical protein n=1 Tax=Planosporangium spinosum TaxID=3402278 RepID=UPI003CF5C3B7
MCDRTGLPLTVLISAANVHDSQLLVPLLDSLARSAPPVAGPAPAPTSCTQTRPTKYQRCGPRSADAAAPSGSPVRAHPRWLCHGLPCDPD